MKRIFLVGYMGAGKTTVGKLLARRMNLNYIDTDHFIEGRYRKKVVDIFNSEGEERFRQIEHRILLEISAFEDVVISTGGGLPCFNDNMTLMNSRGITVYLDVPAEELAKRLETNKNARPVLKQRSDKALNEFVKEHLELRKQFYEQSKIRFQAGFNYTESDIDLLAHKLDSCEY
jgi:shikimate kinase